MLGSFLCKSFDLNALWHLFLAGKKSLKLQLDHFEIEMLNSKIENMLII